MFLILFTLVLVAVSADPQQPQNPVIGLVNGLPHDCPNPPHGSTTCLFSTYVRWLESAGIRVVPFRWDASADEQLNLMEKVNGLLLTGGGSPTKLYFQMWDRIVKKTVEWNAKGDHFVLWGTCLGFQMLCATLAKDFSIITPFHMPYAPVMATLEFTASQPTSRMFGTAPRDVIQIFESKNSTLNWHKYGISPSVWNQNTPLARALRPLATTTDLNGSKFTSAVEGTSAAFYGSQFHPEKISYDFTDDGIEHTKDDIRVNAWLAQFLAEQLKKNDHSFENAAEVEKHSVHNYPVENKGGGLQLYWLP